MFVYYNGINEAYEPMIDNQYYADLAYYTPISSSDDYYVSSSVMSHFDYEPIFDYTPSTYYHQEYIEAPRFYEPYEHSILLEDTIIPQTFEYPTFVQQYEPLISSYYKPFYNVANENFYQVPKYLAYTHEQLKKLVKKNKKIVKPKSVEVQEPASNPSENADVSVNQIEDVIAEKIETPIIQEISEPEVPQEEPKEEPHEEPHEKPHEKPHEEPQVEVVVQEVEQEQNENHEEILIEDDIREKTPTPPRTETPQEQVIIEINEQTPTASRIELVEQDPIITDQTTNQKTPILSRADSISNTQIQENLASASIKSANLQSIREKLFNELDSTVDDDNLTISRTSSYNSLRSAYVESPFKPILPD